MSEGKIASTLRARTVTMPSLIEQVIRDRGGKASLSDICVFIRRLRPGTSDHSIRGVLYHEVDKGNFTKNPDKTYSIPLFVPTKTESVKSSGSREFAKLGPESELYAPVKSELERLFLERFGSRCHLEITSKGHFSDMLKEQVPQSREIIFSFLERRKAFPDITGFRKTSWGEPEFVTVEIKRERIELEHLYQAKKYADLFGAKYGFLISDTRLPDELKKLHRISRVFSQSNGRPVTFGQYEGHSQGIGDDGWFPENPFKLRQ